MEASFSGEAIELRDALRCRSAICRVRQQSQNEQCMNSDGGRCDAHLSSIQPSGERAMNEAKPNRYLRLQREYPGLIAAVETLGDAAVAAGPLDARTTQLVQLAAAAAIRSEGAVHSHARRALAAGASKADIRHALIAVTSTIGFPTVTAALSWVDDVLDAR
jgi:4-carboxymuconolactone decarboxylase